jgi:hypothetical protein
MSFKRVHGEFWRARVDFLTRLGSKKIKCDDQRFLDLKFATIGEVRKQVHHDDANLVGLQRRYDDESRRRAVRRVVPELFAAETFHVVGDDAELVDNMARYGGLISKKFVKKTVTAVVVVEGSADMAALEKFQSEFKFAVVDVFEHSAAPHALGVPVLRAKYIDAVIENHIAAGKPAPNKADFDVFTALSSSTASTTGKRKERDYSIAATDATVTTTTTTATATATSSTSATSKAAKKASSAVGDYRTLLQAATGVSV